ncbi:MAG: DUF3450 family protein [Verrucomicrobia bacterium]|nr:DUF3450 family protein [Verrucomicrobiota bacterium]
MIAALTRRFALWAAGLLLPFGLGAADSPLTSARETVAQWVQTQQLISRTRADWESDREMLQQSKALFERELKSVQEELGKLSTNNSVAELERAKTESELKSMVEALESIKGIEADLEAQLKALKPLFPAPLTATIETLLNRLPATPESSKAGVSERMQTVVAILNEVDKFNNAIFVSNEKQPTEKGELLSVDIIYLGLGQAFFVAPNSDFAGVGVPTPEGWKWTRKDDLADTVRRAVAMYRNQTPAEFLSLPISVQ